jgi:hypothetical protein
MSNARPLTPGETAMAQGVFGDSIDYKYVLVHSGRLFGPMHKENFAKTTLSMIFMHNLYQDDYSKASLGMQELFIHEMAHVWQFQQMAYNPTPLDLQNAVQYNPKAYQYELDKKDLMDYGTEQQASVIAAYFALKARNNPAEKARRSQFEKVLKKFIENPSYAKGALFKTLSKKLSPPKPE